MDSSITVDLQFSGFRVKTRRLGHRFEAESVYVSSIVTFWLFCRTSDSFYG